MFNCLTDLVEAIKDGEVDESILEIRIDSDTTYIYDKSKDEDSDEVFIGEGYMDVFDLYTIMFPRADVDRV